MFEVKNGLILYHGSYCEVEHPDLQKCAPNKDFGKGFYLTTSRDQAINFLKTSILKAVANKDIENTQDFGYLSVFEIKLRDGIEIHTFADADTEWLHCVSAHRKKQLFREVRSSMSKYDIIVGKIADDATNATLTAYMSGAFGEIGSKEADDFCIQRLLPNHLQEQYCFRTSAALECLHYTGSEKIWVKKFRKNN